MQGVATELEHLDPWLDDGSIVIAVQGKYFRVHRSILCFYSEVFKDMFAVPQSRDTEEVIDGCPVVHLPDAIVDVEVMLKALYDRSYIFFPETPMPIAVLSAFLRLGKKYVIGQLFEEGKRRISFGMPPLVRASTISAAGSVALFPRVSGADPFNFMVMNLASEVGLLSTVIVAALHCCIACPALSITDGYDFNGVRCTLSASSKRYCFLIQRYLAEVERQLFECLAYPASNCEYRYPHSPCNLGLLSNLRSIQYIRCPFTIWMDTWDNGLCARCRPELRRKHEEARSKLWENLPVNLGLSCWESIDKDTEISCHIGYPIPSG